jgi:Na+-transporting methylmalonyl-CoA/oxaloacetate decarboxylase gamma subunit
MALSILSKSKEERIMENKNTKGNGASAENEGFGAWVAKLGLCGVKGKIIAVVVLIILANVMWTMTKNEVEAVRQETAARLVKLEEEASKRPESIDLAELRVEVASIKEAAGSFEAKLNAVIKAEEAKLENLQKEAENQKAYIEGLKSLLSGKTVK